MHNWQSGPMCLFIGKQDKTDARNRSLFYDLQSSLLSTAMLYVTVGQCSLLQRSPELELEKERCSGSSELWEIPKQLLPGYILPFYWFCSHTWGVSARIVWILGQYPQCWELFSTYSIILVKLLQYGASKSSLVEANYNQYYLLLLFCTDVGL